MTTFRIVRMSEINFEAPRHGATEKIANWGRRADIGLTLQ
jgi:hypothetical protein